MAGVGGHEQYRSLAINGGQDARGQSASCEGEGTGRDRPAQQRAARRLGVHRQQWRVVRWPARACKERATARAGSRQHRREKKEEASAEKRKEKESRKKLEERNKMDLNKI
jgi:hypothetical protein